MNLSFKRLALAAVAAAALCVGPAGSATAAEPAVWSPQGPMKQTGSIEFRYNGQLPVTCQIKAEGSTSADFFNSPALLFHSCNNGGKIGLSFLQMGQREGTNYRTFLGGTGLSYISPWGGMYKQEPVAVPFTNGLGSKMSTFQFSKTKVGSVTGGGVVTATGTITATTGAGGLITLK